MRRVLTTSLLVAMTVLGGTIRARAQVGVSGARTPVLVELFTSEGCSSCPPADALLKRLAREQPVAGVEIVVLGEHVDYWDELGWHDRFSSAQFTERQKVYARRLRVDDPYTPQMVVDGGEQFVGGDRARAVRAIGEAARRAKVAMAISEPQVSGGEVRAEVTLAGEGGARVERGDEVFAALVQPEAVTDVRKGENGGRRLEHAGVVRVLQRLGELERMKSGPLEVRLRVPAEMDAAEARVVVFAAHRDEGAVVGAASRALRPAQEQRVARR